MKDIYITMFNKFSITYNQKMLDSDSIKSDKIIKLLAYLLVNRQAITSSALTDFIWYSNDIENPIGALKNLIYRLRNLLKNKLQLTDFIITGNGSYCINCDYTIHIDSLEFEQYYTIINSQSGKRLEFYEKLLNLYKGRYLVELKEDHNVITKSTYYHSIFIEKIIEYTNLLENLKQYEEIEKIARKAISIDNLEEDFYIILIRSIYFQKEYQKANEVYKSTTKFLFQTLGIKPSKNMLKLHELIKKEIHDEGLAIDDLEKQLKEDNIKGAFLCEYGTFKEMYIIQSRMIDRLGICSHLCLITLSNHSKINSEIIKNKKVIDKLMVKIETSLVNNLRIGDIISRLSVNQFIILLPGCNYENSILVLDRVLKHIRYSLNHTNISIDITVSEILPK